MTLIAIIYIFFGEYTMLAWGSTPTFKKEPLITASLPEKSVSTYIVKILFCFNFCLKT